MRQALHVIHDTSYYYFIRQSTKLLEKMMRILHYTYFSLIANFNVCYVCRK